MAKVAVTFYGVRGSTPCSSPDLFHFGGNTACVVLEADGEEPIVLDMGTGMRTYGQNHGNNAFNGVVLLSHLHWDHVQGLPFFAPIHRPDSSLAVYGPVEGEKSLGELFDGLMQPPYFPICAEQIYGDVDFREVMSGDFALGGVQVMSRPVPHVGATNGYRVDAHGYSVAYVPDHQQPDDPSTVDPNVLELCDGVDLLIHDAQYTPEQFEERRNWGHCTMDYASEVASQSGAKSLALFHHDPSNNDEILTALVEEQRRLGESRGIVEVFGAVEGESVKFG